jgi:membrane-associated phospholipid phosphatase
VLYEARLAVEPALSGSLDERLGDPNPTASLPSLHFAVTFALYLYGRAHGRAGALLGGAYSVAMGLALVYLGEHYVVDLLFGGAVALGVWWAGARIRLGATGRAVSRLVAEWPPALLRPDRTGNA